MNATSIRKIQEFNDKMEKVRTHGSVTNNIIGRVTGERVGPMAMALLEDLSYAVVAAHEALTCIMEEAPAPPTDWEAKYLELHKEKRALQLRIERMEANSVAWEEMNTRNQEVIREKNQSLWDIVLMAHQQVHNPQYKSSDDFCYTLQHKAEVACGKSFEQSCKDALQATFGSGEAT